MNFYSQSFNFSSAVSGGVDPRTGLFNVNMPLANLVGNDNLGPSLDLSLSYNPLSNSNSGFGKGCSIGTSHYDIQQKLLTLSTGERYKVTETSSQPIIEQKKLDNFRFEKHDTIYRITYKSGVVELLGAPTDIPGETKVPLEIYSPVGHVLNLNWEYKNGEQRLRSITDEMVILLQIEYGATTKVNVFPGTQESYEMVFSFNDDGYLTQLDNNALSSSLSWKFGYNDIQTDSKGVKYHIINEVFHPTGMIERAQYVIGSGMKFPDNAHLTPLPYVAIYTQSPGGGQPDIKTNYSYSPDHNYLGYGSTLDWSAHKDHLYDIPGKYEYYSREVIKSGERSPIRITRIYNKFHLLTEEETLYYFDNTVNDACYQISQTEYYALPEASFNDQPAQFQLPKKQTTTYKDTSKPEGQKSRVEVTLTEFDQWGNLTKKINPDETSTELEYYDKAGEEGCPADPHGFVRFLKKETFRPAPSEFLIPTPSIHYTYELFDSRHHTPVKSMVLLKEEKRERDQKTILSKTITYVNDRTSREHARISQIQTKHYDLNSSSKPYVSQENFSFNVQGEVLCQGEEFTGHDGLKSSIKKEQSRYNGKLLSETDNLGNKTSYTYDKLGRILKRTLNPGTQYENTITTEYSLVKNPQGKVIEISTTQTDAKGNKERTYFDALGRTIKQMRNDRDSASNSEEFIEILKQDYDELGRKRKVTTRDHVRKGGNLSEEMILTAELFYDNWGENHLTSFSDGHKEYSLYDPILMESTTYMQAEGVNQGKQVTKYNKQGLPISITNFDASGNNKGLIQNEYDGLGQLRWVTDEFDQITRYEYDALGRMLKQTLPDDTIIEKRYARHSDEVLTTSIGVTDNLGQTFLLGEREFDGLNRLTYSKNGGRTYRYEYEGASPTPSKVTTPTGEILNYHYIPQLDNALERLEYKIGENTQQQTFTYDKLTGLLTEARQSQGMDRSMQYNPSGLVKSESFSLISGQSQRVSYTYSLLGKLRNYVNVSGAHQSYSYDGYGKHILTDDPLVKVEFGYDKLSRLTERKATNKATGAFMKAAFTYDDFNREVKREISLNNDAIAVIESSYRHNNQLKGRITKRAEATLRHERFNYDVRNRLTQYTCSGSELPVDAYGKAINKQSFSYDALGNIKVCITDFDGGSDTATFHYDNQDPTQLTSVSHSHTDYPRSIALQYDANGRLIQDEASRSLSYDALGRLSALSVNGSKRGEYSYDALDNLVVQKVDENDQRELYYLGDVLVNEIHHKGNKKEHIRLIKDGNTTLAISSDTLQLTAIDAMGSLLSAVSAQGNREDFRYAPYGSSANRSSATSLVGFNGERMDPISGTYHLGNGYRAYNPVLMRFNCPDSLSPFGAGGINPYVYCAGDPINRFDPSGHLSWQAWLGIGIGIVSLIITGGFAIGAIAAAGGVAAALGSASATALVVGGIGVVSDVTAIASGALEESNPEASATLGWVSLGTGVVGLASAGVSIGKGVSKSVSKLSKRVQLIREQGLSGRGAPKAAGQLAQGGASSSRGAETITTEALLGVKKFDSTNISSRLKINLGEGGIDHTLRGHLLREHKSFDTVANKSQFPREWTTNKVQDGIFEAMGKTTEWKLQPNGRYMTEQSVEGLESPIRVIVEKMKPSNPPRATDAKVRLITAYPSRGSGGRG